MELKEQILNYVPFNEQEERDKKLLLEWLSQPDVFERKNEKAHFTSSAWVLNPERTKVLMIYHNIYDSWAWMGGHADGEEDMLATALREAKEESGLEELSPLSPAPTGLDILTVKGHFKRGKWVVPHLHLSLCYSFVADPNQQLRIKPDENSGVQWLPVDRLAEFVSEPDLLPVYDRIIRRTKALLL